MIREAPVFAGGGHKSTIPIQRRCAAS